MTLNPLGADLMYTIAMLAVSDAFTLILLRFGWTLCHSWIPLGQELVYWAKNVQNTLMGQIVTFRRQNRTKRQSAGQQNKYVMELQDSMEASKV